MCASPQEAAGVYPKTRKPGNPPGFFSLGDNLWPIRRSGYTDPHRDRSLPGPGVEALSFESRRRGFHSDHTLRGHRSRVSPEELPGESRGLGATRPGLREEHPGPREAPKAPRGGRRARGCGARGVPCEALGTILSRGLALAVGIVRRSAPKKEGERRRGRGPGLKPGPTRLRLQEALPSCGSQKTSTRAKWPGAFRMRSSRVSSVASRISASAT